MIKITRITNSNTALLTNLDDNIFDEKIKPELLAAYVLEKNHIMMVAIDNDLVIGQVLAIVHRHPDKPTELYIGDLAVSEKRQRQGIATQLLRELFQIGKEMGCTEVWVATEPDNIKAIKFYESMKLSPRTSTVFESFLK